MACVYCRREHAGECPQNPMTLLRQLRAAAIDTAAIGEQARQAANGATRAAERAQAMSRLALEAAASAHQTASSTIATLAVYERTHPGGIDRRSGHWTRRTGMKDDWLRWKNPERRLGPSERRGHA